MSGNNTRTTKIPLFLANLELGACSEGEAGLTISEAPGIGGYAITTKLALGDIDSLITALREKRVELATHLKEGR